MEIRIHADDLGATASVDESIWTVLQAGGIDGASVLANGDSLENTAARLNDRCGCSIRLRVHLNLSEGRPLSDPASIEKLVDSEGRFRYGFCGILGLWLRSGDSERQRLRKMIKQEFTAQVKRVIDLFGSRSVCGVDGHIHVHMLPFIFDLASRACSEHGLQEIRITREIPHFAPTVGISSHFMKNILKHLLLNALASRAKIVSRKYGLNSAEYVAGVLYSGLMSDSTARAAVNAALRRGCNSLELLFHPGRANIGEISRWKGQEKIAAFYLDPKRDIEKNALVGIARGGAFGSSRIGRQASSL